MRGTRAYVKNADASVFLCIAHIPCGVQLSLTLRRARKTSNWRVNIRQNAYKKANEIRETKNDVLKVSLTQIGGMLPIRLKINKVIAIWTPLFPSINWWFFREIFPSH